MLARSSAIAGPAANARQKTPISHLDIVVLPWGGDAIERGPLSSRLLQLEGAEEVGDLEGSGRGGVGAVDGVGLDGGGEVLADGAGGGLGRIGGAHEVAPLLDGA